MALESIQVLTRKQNHVNGTVVQTRTQEMHAMCILMNRAVSYFSSIVKVC
jgi:hypothetical protein